MGVGQCAKKACFGPVEVVEAAHVSCMSERLEEGGMMSHVEECKQMETFRAFTEVKESLFSEGNSLESTVKGGKNLELISTSHGVGPSSPSSPLSPITSPSLKTYLQDSYSPLGLINKAHSNKVGEISVMVSLSAQNGSHPEFHELHKSDTQPTSHELQAFSPTLSDPTSSHPPLLPSSPCISNPLTIASNLETVDFPDKPSVPLVIVLPPISSPRTNIPYFLPPSSNSLEIVEDSEPNLDVEASTS